VAALLAGILGMTTPVRAQLPLDTDAPYDRNRFYFGLGAIFGVEDLHVGAQPTSTGTASVDVEDTNWGGEMRAGYRFHPHLAAELQGQYNGLYEVRANTVGRPSLGSVEVITSTANLKAYALRGPVQPYALGGVGIMWADTEDRVAGAKLPLGDVEFAGRGGIGVDMYISPMLAINVEGSYVAPTGDLAGYGVAAIVCGAQWHF
jgi:opacity protein-like surface antigen